MYAPARQTLSHRFLPSALKTGSAAYHICGPSHADHRMCHPSAIASPQQPCLEHAVLVKLKLK